MSDLWLPARITVALVALAATARGDEVRTPRELMRDVAIAKANPAPPAGLPPGRVAAATRAEAHRLAVEAAVRSAGLQANVPGVPPSEAQARRAADNNASAQGTAHSATATGHAGSVRENGGGLPGPASKGKH